MRRRTSSKDRQTYNLGGRYLAFIIIVLVMFGYLISGVFNLQLLSSDEYTATAENRRTTTITLRGSRGMITDADAVILARDDDVYNVTFYRDAGQNSGREYAEFSDSIRRTSNRAGMSWRSTSSSAAARQPGTGNSISAPA